MLTEEKISQEELNQQTENNIESGRVERPGVVDEELYKKEEKKVEQAIEKSGEKLKSHTTTIKNGDEQDVDIRDVEKSINEMKKLDVDDQVDHLVQVAIHQSPVLAISIAKELQNNYILAEVHSDLTEDKIRDILKEKGLMK